MASFKAASVMTFHTYCMGNKAWYDNIKMELKEIVCEAVKWVPVCEII